MNQPPTPPETTYLVWICRQCRKACKIQPELFEPECRCKTPVPGLRPTEVTQMHAPPRPAVRALSDEEARLRGLIRVRRRLRITYEGDIAEAWTSPGARGEPVTYLIVTTPDGRRHVVDSSLPGVRIEAAEDLTKETS